MNIRVRIGGVAVGVWLIALAGWAAPAPVPDSARLSRAKDFIADEQWARAVAELKPAAADPKEPNRDEVLFWLAHSEYQAGDSASALASVARLEEQFPSSRWVRPARSLRIEIAQRLDRDDVLWRIAAPPPPPPIPTELPAAPGVPPARAPRPPTPSWAPLAVAPPAPPAPPVPETGVGVINGAWTPTPVAPDTDLRIEALSSLMPSHAERVIPLLKAIALDAGSPGEARRAVFVLAQSDRPEARTTVVELAKQAAEPVRIAAVRELGQFGGPNASAALMQVYQDATPRVKREVVTSLGERADAKTLFRIARLERDPQVRNRAIITLGTAGGREQLRRLYLQSAADRSAVLLALFNARDEDGLIDIAEHEHDARLRADALVRLRLLGTAKARAYLAAHPR